jgi:arylsulfatase A
MTICQSWRGIKCIYQGEWKLILGNATDGIHFERHDCPPLQLYNMAEDLGENTNVCDQHPEVVARLTGLLEKYSRDERSVPPVRFA